MSFSELFHRSAVTWPSHQISSEYFANKTVLITGAGGSIGSALSSHIASLQPRKLILLGRGEHSLYAVMSRLSTAYPDVDLQPILVDIQSLSQLNYVFANSNIELVFHTAAYKHVNILEKSPCQAVLNNVLGTRNVVRASQHAKVDRLIFISTDKSVEPVGILGATKKLCECMLSREAIRSVTDLVSVRFGNIFRSSGNVVGLFEQQAKRDRCITITDPNAIRFFMDIEDATHTIITAGMEAEDNEVAILDVGEPIRVGELADSIVKSLNLIPHVDVRYDYIGLQPGEKLIEKLYTDAEEATMRRIGSMMYTRTDISDFLDDESAIESLIERARAQDDAMVRLILAKCVPGYTPMVNE